jgi:hypothetical protein
MQLAFSMRRTLLIFALAVIVAAPAGAQTLKLAFNGGRVSVDAAAVPIRTILNEWAKLGGTKIVGAERLAGAPLTLKLDDVPESQALEIILRSVAGYMAAPRGATAGASMYDRILVMATSSGPAPAPARPGAANNTNLNPNNGTQRFIPPRPARQEQPENDEDTEEDPNPPNPPVFTFPQPGQPGFNQPGTFNGPMLQQGGTVNVNPATGMPQTITINPNPNQPPMPAGPTTPFGTTGATLPGMIQQPVVQPGQVVPGVRPPGV